MDNPEKDRTTINVKSIRKSAWEAAKRGATQQGDTMGTWLSDAIDQRVRRDANQVEPPGNPPVKNGADDGNPTPPVTALDLMDRLGPMAQGVAALFAVKGAPKSEVRHMLAMVGAALGQPPRRIPTRRGKAAGKDDGAEGKELAVVGQSGQRPASDPHGDPK